MNVPVLKVTTERRGRNLSPRTERARALTACMSLLVVTLGAITAQGAEGRSTASKCAMCHDTEVQEWKGSRHAQAMGTEFLNVWQAQGNKWECLPCHASVYDRTAGTYSHEGISCESCHGAMNARHPNEAKMTLPVTSEVCQPCHSITHGQWRISAHGQKNIRCFDCHKTHQMKQRKEDPDQMCGACHTERLKSFSHATHHLKGVLCIDCHMPKDLEGGIKIKGTGVPGHTFGVGAETCARCHREMVHQSHDRTTLQEEVVRLKALTPVSLTQKLTNLEGQTTKLRASLDANRRVFPVIVVLGFALGMIVEYALVYYRRKKRAGAAQPSKGDKH